MKKSDKKKINKRYEKELYKLQVELNYLQRWVQATGDRAIILFQFPYEHIKFDKPILPKRQKSGGYVSPDWSTLYVPEKYDFRKSRK